MKKRVRLPIPDQRPKTYGECKDIGIGDLIPCPFVSCKYHLYTDWNPGVNRIRINFPDKDPTDLEYTCTLREAARGGLSLDEVAERLNLVRERVRQLDVSAKEKIQNNEQLLDFLQNEHSSDNIEPIHPSVMVAITEVDYE